MAVCSVQWHLLKVQNYSGFSTIRSYSATSPPESCSSNIRYSVNGTSPECCRVDGSTCGVRCDLDLGISNATINVTFTCFDLASITLFSKGDIFNGMILEENLTLTNDNQSTSQDGLALNRTIACVTSLFLRLRFSAAITDPASIEFSNVTCSKYTQIFT